MCSERNVAGLGPRSRHSGCVFAPGRSLALPELEANAAATCPSTTTRAHGCSQSRRGRKHAAIEGPQRSSTLESVRLRGLRGARGECDARLELAARAGGVIDRVLAATGRKERPVVGVQAEVAAEQSTPGRHPALSPEDDQVRWRSPARDKAPRSACRTVPVTSKHGILRAPRSPWRSSRQ